MVCVVSDVHLCGVGFGVWGVWCGVWGMCGVWCGCGWVWDVGFRVWGVLCGVWGSEKGACIFKTMFGAHKFLLELNPTERLACGERYLCP